MTPVKKALGLALVSTSGIAGYAYFTKKSALATQISDVKSVPLSENQRLKKYFETKKSDSEEKEIDTKKIEKLESFLKGILKGPKGQEIEANKTFLSDI